MSTNQAASDSALDLRWLIEQHGESFGLLQRLFAAIPTERRLLAPPSRGQLAPLGSWSAHRHVFHLVHYERQVALPALKLAVAGEAARSAPTDEQQAYDPLQSAETLLRELKQLRREQADLLARASSDALSTPVPPWRRPALWSALKTVQHTLEHANELGRLALFWEWVEEGLAKSEQASPEIVARRWLSAFQECVRAVDYDRAKPLVATDVVSFGTHATVVSGRDALEQEQWRHVWPRIREFAFRLDEIRCFGDDERITVVAPWDSLGVAPDGALFHRPGRATLVLARQVGRWVAVHTHFSLEPRA